MKFDWIDKVLTAAKDYHIPCAMAIFATGTVLQWFHHMDSNYVGFAGLVLGAITGHCFSNHSDGN